MIFNTSETVLLRKTQLECLSECAVTKDCRSIAFSVYKEDQKCLLYKEKVEDGISVQHNGSTTVWLRRTVKTENEQGFKHCFSL